MVDIYVAGAVPVMHNKSAIISFAHGSDYRHGCGYAKEVVGRNHKKYAGIIHGILLNVGVKEPNANLLRDGIANLRRPEKFADGIIKSDGTLEIRKGRAEKVLKALQNRNNTVVKKVTCADARVVARYASEELNRIILQNLEGGNRVIRELFCAHEGVEQKPGKITLGNNGSKAYVNDAFVTAHPQFVELFDKACNGKLSKEEAGILAPLSFSLFYGSHFVNARIQSQSDALREFAEESRRWWLASKAHH